MTTAIKVNKARADIFKDGKKVVEKGQTYWRWKFAFGEMQYSLTEPRRSQLTQSWFLKEVFDIEDDMKDVTENTTHLLDYLDEAEHRLSELESKVKQKMSNMNPSLRKAKHTGEVMMERIDTLRELQNDIALLSGKIRLEGLSNALICAEIKSINFPFN